MSSDLSCPYCGEYAGTFNPEKYFEYCSKDCYYTDIEEMSGPYELDEDEWRFPED